MIMDLFSIMGDIVTCIINQDFQVSSLVTQKSFEIFEMWKPLADWLFEATFKQTASEARARLQARRKQRSSVLSALAVLEVWGSPSHHIGHPL